MRDSLLHVTHVMRLDTAQHCTSRTKEQIQSARAEHGTWAAVTARGKEGSKQMGSATRMAGPSGQTGEESQGPGNGQCAEERDGKTNMASDDIGFLVAKNRETGP